MPDPSAPGLFRYIVENTLAQLARIWLKIQPFHFAPEFNAFNKSRHSSLQVLSKTIDEIESPNHSANPSNSLPLPLRFAPASSFLLPGLLTLISQLATVTDFTQLKSREARAARQSRPL